MLHLELQRAGGAGRVAVAVALLVVAAWAVPCHSQVASSLINEGDPLPDAPGQSVSGINNTAVNRVDGYAATLNSSGAATLSHIWGNPTGGAGMILRTETTIGSLVQTSFESFYGMDDSGALCYSASGTGGPDGGFDAVFKDDTPIAVEGDPHPTLPGQFWSFASRPGITADGIPYLVGGLRETVGGATSNRGIFIGMNGDPVIIGGDVLPNLPGPLDTGTTVSFDYRYSTLGTHYIVEVQIDGLGTGEDNAMVVDGAGLLLDGALVREGTPVPAAVGGLPGENWDNFDFDGYTEAGEYFFTGDTDGDIATDEFILENGMIVLREGDMLDGETLSGAIEGAFMNEDGDLAFIWDIQGGTLEALYLNDMLLLKEGDEVDLDGDGVLDPGVVLTDFTGISSLTLTDRDLTGQVKVYFTADVNTGSAVIEGFYCMAIDLGGTTPVLLSSFDAVADPEEHAVELRWSTSFEQDHLGFHVYRSFAADGDYARLNTELVAGESPYSYVDRDVQPTTTYYYRIEAVDREGGVELHGPARVTTPAWGLLTMLRPNSPNPFIGQTDIPFTLSTEGRVRLSIYDVGGRLVRTVIDGSLPAGDHSVTWDGFVDQGGVSPQGVYFYRLEAGDRSQTRKMVKMPASR